MSKRKPVSKMCGTKTRYETKEMAEQAAGMSTMRFRDGHILHAYQCKICKHWHIGH